MTPQHLATLFPPPEPVQRCAWYCAYRLGTMHRARISRTEATIICRVLGSNHTDLDWSDIARCRLIFRMRAGVKA